MNQISKPESPEAQVLTSKTNSQTNRDVNVEIKKVFRIYQQGELEVVALKDVSLKIYAGEILVIMGPSGSGKTTLLNCISGLDQPNAGSIHIRGFDITKMNDIGVQKILQNEIGVIFQFFNLVPSLTAQGNVELPMVIANKPKDYQKMRSPKLLKWVGIEDRAHHRPHTLSGGEKQRVAIAMAFANNPNVILADEPTGNIDSITSEKISLLFKNYIQENPEKSIVIVTHNPALRKIADRTLVIKDGQIIRELGKEKEKNPNLQSSSDETDEIIGLNAQENQVNDILNPNHAIPSLTDITCCPHCHSNEIVVKLNQNGGHFRLINDQLISDLAIYCKSCHKLEFIAISLQYLKLPQ